MMINLEAFATSAALCLFAGALNQEAQQTEVLLDSTLRLLSVAGAIGGGFMALAFFPQKPIHDKSAMMKADAMRWLGCSFFGGSFSPFVVEYVLPKYGLPITTATALATSAFLGMFAWLLVSGMHSLIKSKMPSE